jgi:two-component system sensor histidine kinase KdpD
MLQYMRAHGLAGPWAASERLLVCVHGGQGAAELVRYTERLADRLKAPWTVLHVETAHGRHRGRLEQDRMADTLRLAERLGGESLVLPGEKVAEEVLEWARSNNITQIVIGSERRPAWQDRLKSSLPREIIRGAGDIKVHVLPAGGETVPAKRIRARPGRAAPQPLPFLVAIGLVLVAAGASVLLDRYVDLPNMALVFLAPVLLAALWYGLWPALASVLLASLSYNLLFTEPHNSFTIEQPENVTALVVFTIVAVITSTLASRSRSRTFAARREAARSAALYSFARKLAGVATMDDLLWAAAHQIASMLAVEVVLLLPEGERLVLQAAYPPEDRLSEADLAAATWCWQKDQPAGRGADTLPGAPRLFLPMRTGRGKLGVVGIRSDIDGPLLTPDQRRLLDALLDQTAVAVERVQLARDVDETRLLAETERLRTALLTSLGHDLKTPLASILGTISSLRSFGALYDDATRDEMLGTAQEEAERLARFLDNLRDMTRLEAGALGPRREPVDLADAVGSALRRVQRLVSGHRVVTDLPPDLPLVRLDFVLLEQTPVNLLENAARYAPKGGTIEIAGRREADALLVEVRDDGPGIDAGEIERIFEKFYRGREGTRTSSGIGLGLAVCKGFIEAMGGTIQALPRGDREGTVVRLRFPEDLVVPATAEVPTLAR